MTAIARHPRTIDSLNHPHIKRIQHLRLRSEREKSGLFYVEGLRFICQAVQHSADIEMLVVCRPLLNQPYAQKLVRHQRRRGITILEVTLDVMCSLSLMNDPQGVGAVVKQRWETLSCVQPAEGLCWIALHTVRSAGNLGTILRTEERPSTGVTIAL